VKEKDMNAPEMVTEYLSSLPTQRTKEGRGAKATCNIMG